MQELVYCLRYVLENLALLKIWVDIEVEMSGKPSLIKDLGRHRGRDGKCMCNLYNEDCESVNHFLWNYPAY